MRITKQIEPIDTVYFLMMKYRRPSIPLSEVLPDHLPHLCIEVANKRAAKCDLPFPTFKPDGNKSPYYVYVIDIALWLDAMHQIANQDWKAMNT